MAKNLFNRYIWLVDTIYRNGKLSFKEINDKWLQTDFSEGKPIPLRTFHNHREAIQDLFDINIECNKSTHEYYIEDADQLSKGTLRNWLLNTFTVNNLINEKYKLQNRILLENVPSGQKYLTPIIEAMRDEKRISVTYQSFNKNEPETFDIEPYFVKLFKQRWYIIGYSMFHKMIRIYALDRIQVMQMTDKTFELPQNFLPEEYFKDCFGIIHGEGITETVMLKVKGNQVKYFRELPLHISQKEITRGINYSIFQYNLKVTFDLVQEILSYAPAVEVLAPKSLREEILKILLETCKLYDR